MVGGTYLASGKIPLLPMVGGTVPTPRRSLISVNLGGGANQERCTSIMRWMRIILEAAGTQWMNIPMAVRVRQTGDRPVAACTRYLGDNLNIEITQPSQRKMIKRQRTGNRPMATGTQRADFCPKIEAYLYLKRA